MKISQHFILNGIVEIRFHSDIFTCFIDDRNHIAVDSRHMMDVRSLYYLRFQTFQICHFYPDIGTSGPGTVNSFCVSQKDRIFSVISVKTNQAHRAMRCLGRNSSVLRERNRHTDRRFFLRHRDRPRTAVLQQFPVVIIRMADRPV